MDRSCNRPHASLCRLTLISSLLLFGPMTGAADAATTMQTAGGADRSLDSSVVPGGLERTFEARAADAINVRDFGAVGSGTAHPVGSTLQIASLAALAAYMAPDGSHPYAWVTNPVYGLNFSLPLGLAQPAPGSTLNFAIPSSNLATGPFSTGYNYAAQADVVLPGMGVTGACLAAGTTVAAVATAQPVAATTAAAQSAPGQTLALPFTGGIVPGESVYGPNIPAGDIVSAVTANAVTLAQATKGAVPAGTAIGFAGAASVMLSAPTRTGCAAGAMISFALTNAQVQALDMDWLGMQAAVVAAWSNPYGGAVHIPQGNYLLSRMVVNPGITDSNDIEPQVEIYGDGMLSTRLLMTADTGYGSCAFGEGNRSQRSMSRSFYHGFRLMGPGPGAPYGASPAGMDGLCIGEKARVQRVLASGFHAGFNLMRDHQMLENVEGDGDYFGLEYAANSDTFGNQHLVADGFSGTLASVAIAWNGSFESSMFDNVSVGFTPYSFYREAAPLGATSALPMLGGCTFNGVYGESIGNAFIYGENGAADTIVSNSWTGVSPTLDPSGAYKLPGRPVAALVYAGSWFQNTLIGSDFGSGMNYGLVSDAIFEIANNVQANKWADPISSTDLILNAGKPIFKAGTLLFNTFAMDRAQGEFRRAEAPITAGQVVAFGQWGYDGGATPMSAGLVPVGVSMTSAPAGGIVAVARSGLANTLKSTAAALTQGQPVVLNPAAPTSVTSPANAPGGTAIGVVADAGNVAAATATVWVDLHQGP